MSSATDASLHQALAYQQTGRLAEALQLYEQVLAAEPDNARALNFAGAAYVQLGEAARGIELLERATAVDPNYAEAYHNLGVVLRDAGRLQEAVAAHRRMLEIAPDDAEGYNDLGIVLRKMDNTAGAEEAYRRAIELRADYADAHYNLGNALLHQDKVEEAIHSYQRAAAFKPDNPRIYRMLGTALQVRGELEGAIASYRRALDIDSKDASTYANLASVLVEKGDLQAGVEYFRRAVQLNPRVVGAHAGLGVALHDSGDIEGAVAEYDACLTLDPGNTRALAYKAIALEQLGKGDAARELLDFDRFVWLKRLHTPKDFRSLAEFNAALGAYARGHPTLMHERAGKTTRGGTQTSELFTHAEGVAAVLLAELEQIVASYVRALPEDTRHPFSARRPQRPYRISGWATLLDSGGYQYPHVHPGGWLSGVYYVQVPESIGLANAGEAGWIEFGRPDPRFREETATKWPVRTLRPEEGLLVLFPSYFWHRTLPFSSSKQRISYAFDLLR